MTRSPVTSSLPEIPSISKCPGGNQLEWHRRHLSNYLTVTDLTNGAVLSIARTSGGWSHTIATINGATNLNLEHVLVHSIFDTRLLLSQLTRRAVAARRLSMCADPACICPAPSSATAIGEEAYALPAALSG